MGRPKKKIEPAIDVIGRKISWKPKGSDRLFGEVINVYMKHYKPKKPLYETQRFLRKFVTVAMYDGRVLSFSAEQDDIKEMGIVADG